MRTPENITTEMKFYQLRVILNKQLEKYRKYKELEKTGEVDSSYIYDMASEWFNDLSRGDFEAILAILDLPDQQTNESNL